MRRAAAEKSPPPDKPAKPPAQRRTFADLIAGYPPEIRTIALRLQKLVRATLAGAEENIYGGSKAGLALYSKGSPTNVYCGIQPAMEYCLLYVHHAQELAHPDLRIEGHGKHARHVKFRDADEIHPEAVRWLLRQIRQRAGK